ncbi:uncharacterized protein LOC26535959 [Drosophila yakuba]|uniref:Secreted protein n=1 Tax=Drosophila yakuba TaxID=7245 RepID=A0A0R1E642_DROYA|nr:uncharacterized protein LOC26535959 [Drosophila yakuba]KRK04648.1 uncharacterized protein Dyak_GE28778 [Drosophila yakuba]
MKSYLLLGILLYYLCTLLLIEGRDVEFKEENDNIHLSDVLLCTNTSLQNQTRLNRSSLGGHMRTDHLGRNRVNHRSRAPTRRRRKHRTTPKLKYYTPKINPV